MFGMASWQRKAVLILGMIGAVSALGFPEDSPGRTRLLGAEQAGGPRLISVEPLPEPEGSMCEWPPASTSLSLRFRMASASAACISSSPRRSAPNPLRLAAFRRLGEAGRRAIGWDHPARRAGRKPGPALCRGR
jgi:hypothetical protein